MKKVIIIVLALLILAGGGVGAMTYLGIGPFAGLLAKKEPDPAEKPTEAPPPAPTYLTYDIGSFIIPVVVGKGISKQIGIDLAIEVDSHQNENVGSQIPRIQNQFNIVLYDLIPSHADAHSISDRQAIHDSLKRTANKLLGDGAIHDIIVKSIYER